MEKDPKLNDALKLLNEAEKNGVLEKRIHIFNGKESLIKNVP
jgi:hypothetical protein